jgi:hypothetical protein
VAGLALVAAMMAAGPAADAANLGTLSLDAPAKVVSWSGSNADFSGQGYQSPLDAACTPQTAAQTQSPAPCDIFTLHVDLLAADVPGGVHGPKSPTAGGITKLQPYPNLPGDGVLVSIKWPTDFDQWNLYVDNAAASPVGGTANCTTRSQAPAAIGCGSDLDSNSQSLLIPWPMNANTPVAHWVADYPVKVVPFYTDFIPKVDKSYVGRAEMYTDALQRMSGHSPILPRIQTPSPSNFHVADVPPIPSNPTGWRFTSPGTFSNSCYLDETIQYGSTKCLRFDNGINNIGTGPLTLEFQYDANALQTAITNETDIPAGQCHMNQEILWTDSATTDAASLRDAGPCIFHVAHMHFHYQNMGRYKLFALGAGGNPHAVAWPDPGQASADPVAHSNKIGFCTIDVDNITFGKPAPTQRPRTYSFPTCNVPNGYQSTSAAAATCAGGLTAPQPCLQYVGAPEYMGISPGWGDIYTWDLPTQYIDISNVPDGVYEVTSSSNPDGGMLTADHLPPAPGLAPTAAGTNGTSLPSSLETGVTCIQIKTDASGATTATTVEEFPSQPNDAPLPVCDLSRVALKTTPASLLPGNGGLPNTSTAGPSRPPRVFPGAAGPWPAAIPAALAALLGASVLLSPRRRHRVG